MTKRELRELVIDQTGRPDKVRLIDSSLDQAIEKITQLYPWMGVRSEVDIPLELQETQLQLPENLYQITELRLLVPSSPTLSYPMELIRKNEFVKLFPNVTGSTITGRPLWCYRENNQLYLDRKSNGVYAVRVSFYSLGRFESDTDSSPIPGSDEALVAYATANIYRAIQMYQDAGMWDQRFGALVALLMNSERREIGTHFVAQEWERRNPLKANQPWLDPFEGHQQ